MMMMTIMVSNCSRGRCDTSGKFSDVRGLWRKIFTSFVVAHAPCRCRLFDFPQIAATRNSDISHSFTLPSYSHVGWTSCHSRCLIRPSLRSRRWWLLSMIVYTLQSCGLATLSGGLLAQS